VLDWRLEKILFYSEALNGAGYSNRGVPSPYIWSFTNQYVRGKYDYDGHYNSGLVDPQPGCAAMLATIAKLDKTITFVRET
jgi:lysozyme family protein